MRDRLPFLALIPALAIATACGGGSQSAAPPATTAPAAAAAPADDAGAEASDAAVEGSFGVAECDQFFEKYFACIDANVPEQGRAAVRQSAEATRQALQQSAQHGAAAQDALKMGCTQAEAAARQSMAAYHCDW